MDRCSDGCAKGSENRSGLVWHAEGEGLKSRRIERGRDREKKKGVSERKRVGAKSSWRFFARPEDVINHL